MKKILFMLLAMFTMALSSAPLHAEDQLINVQFGPVGVYPYGDYTGNAMAGGDEPQKWNALSGTQATNYALNNSAGVSSGVRLTYTSDFVGSTNAENVPFSEPENSLYRSYIYSSSTNDYLLFSGLAAGEEYELYVYTQSENTEANNWGDGQRLSMSVNGTALSATTDSDGAASSFILNQNYLTGTYYANANGQIRIDYQASTGSANKAVINGVQLRGPTPEPATLLLLGVGGALAAAKLRRKKGLEASSASAA